MSCEVTSSANEVCGRGSSALCSAHRYRLRRYDDVQADRPIRDYNLTEPRKHHEPYPGETEEERFWSRVDKSGGCWLWRGSTMTSGGTGQAIFGGFSQSANRIAWILAYGTPPEAMVVVRTCGDLPCVRPDHLALRGELVDEQEVAA